MTDTQHADPLTPTAERWPERNPFAPALLLLDRLERILLALAATRGV